MAKRTDLNTSNLDDHPDDGGKLAPGPGKESFKLAAYWKSQVADYEQGTKRWFKRGNTVVKRLRDERNRIDEEGQRRMNVLWANYKIMKPAIYSQCPTPVVDRKFLDHDVTGRLSCQILERSLINELESSGYHNAISMAVSDRLLPGRGTVWCRYVPTIGEGPSIPTPTKNGGEDPLYDIGKETGDKKLTGESDSEESLEQTGEQVLAEKVEVDYVDWRDLYLFPVKARHWAEVQAVGKKVHISKKEARERFGEKIGKALKPDTEPKLLGNTERNTYSDTSIFEDINERTITIFEIWNKSDQRVYWLSTGYDYLCDIKDDPLELTSFFPIPPCLMATQTNDTLIPVPDFIEWQDQAIQIDELTQRIAMLTKACKVAGVYNAAAQGVNRIFNESIENELIPVDQWAMFADAGGLKGVLDFIPLDQIIACIETLTKVREQAKIDLDQITGISDILRGTTDSRETLGGLRLKNNSAGTRLSEDQEAAAKFARDTLVIMAEIISKHFDDETLIETSGILHDEALQPDVIMREYLVDQMPGWMQAPQQPQQAPQQAPPQQGQGAPPAPSPTGQPTPQMHMQPPAGGPPQPPQQGQNVVPFPGGQQSGQTPSQPMQTGASVNPPDPQVLIMMKVQKAIALLRKDVARGYRIDIETDSTIFGDKEQEKENATEFIGAVSGYMQQLEQASKVPESLPLFAKALQWAVRKFRVGRDLEAEIDNFAEAMSKKSKQMIANPQQSPEDKKADAELKKIQMESQSQQQNDARAAQMQEQNDQRDAQMQQQKNAMETQKMQMDMEMEKQRNAMEMQKMQMEMEIAREEHQMKLREMQMKMHMEGQKVAVQAQGQQMEIQAKHQEHAMDMQQAHEQHALDRETMKHEQKHMQIKAQHKEKEQAKAHKEKMKPKPQKKAS